MTQASPEKSRIIRSIVLIVALIASGGALGSLLYVTREEPPRRDTGRQAPVVDVYSVRAGDVTEQFLGYGTGKADRTARIASQVAATVIERVGEIREGDQVNAGQALLRLDDREYRHALDRAKALAAADMASIKELEAELVTLKKLRETAQQELRVARDERDRLADLFEQGHAAKKEFDFANLAYQQARRITQGYEMEIAKNAPRRHRFEASRESNLAAAAIAALNIERCEIRAPFAGTIQSLLLDVGDHAAPGVVALTLVDSSHIEIPIQLPLAVYDRVRVGARCILKAESMRGVSWEGRITRVAPVADQQTRTFAAYIDVDNAAQQQPLVPGTFVTAEVEGPTYRDSLTVPRGAIREGGVYVVRDGMARRLPVRVVRHLAERAIVEGAIADGDDVIVSQLADVEDGAQVRVHDAVSAAPDLRAPGIGRGIEVSP